MTIGTYTDLVHLPGLHGKEATAYKLSLQVEESLLFSFENRACLPEHFLHPGYKVLEIFALEYPV
jgi:hypothetical protein